MTVDTVMQDQSRSLRRRGALILALFALLWAAVGASGLPSGAAWTVRIAAVVVSAGVILLTFRLGHAGAPERQRRQPEGWYRHVGVVNLAQFGTIALAVLILVAVEAPELVPPVVCLIVGLHFFPLARLFVSRSTPGPPPGCASPQAPAWSSLPSVPAPRRRVS